MRSIFCIVIGFISMLVAGARADTGLLPGEVIVNGVEFVRIPAGEFEYTVETNSAHLQPDGPPLYRQVRVWLDDFYLAKYEARARDQERFMNAGAVSLEALARLAQEQAEQVDVDRSADPGCTVRRRADGHYYRPEADHDLPATNLSWEIAVEFAQWMGFRLPTEAEWEKAARGPDRRIWPWGNDYPDDTYALFTWTKSCHPVPVNAYPKGRSPYGLHNMAGNVAEHVSDWYSTDFDAGLKDGVHNPMAALQGTPVPYQIPQKISKGGRWSQGPAQQAIAARRLLRPAGAAAGEGVRFALDVAFVRQHLAQGTAHIVNDSP
jgi:formylglycine-generating enzyme required for sulfatase activity